MKWSERFEAMCFGVCIAVAAFGAMVACTARQAAKTGYEAASQACLVAYDDAAHQKDCLSYVRNRYTEAGAPPAAQLDGGSHE